MLNTKQKGFTLIELLVVIAIIGLLAGIVLVSLGGARDRARDGRIQADIAQVKTLAELVYNYSDDFSYSDATANHSLCDTTTTPPTLNGSHVGYGTELTTLSTDIATNGGSDERCYSAGDDYCVSVDMNEGTICIHDGGSTGSVACTAATDTCS